ncbi:MAG: VOC family protein [Firmicutes bacterium]|nr:VOC family protein [Bacillota bacterium]
MKMLHVTIQTNRFEEEMKFYQEVVGLKLSGDMRPRGKNLVFLSDEEGATAIEIIENPGAENSGNENLSVGFKTDDVEAKREELLAAGFDVTPMISPMPQVKFFFVKDPAGMRVQFM